MRSDKLGMVAQRSRTDCGVATLANLLNARYEDAVAMLDQAAERHPLWRDYATEGIATMHLCMALALNSIVYQECREPPAAWSDIPDPAAVALTCRDGTVHWVALIGGRVLDPWVGVMRPNAVRESLCWAIAVHLPQGADG